MGANVIGAVESGSKLRALQTLARDMKTLELWPVSETIVVENIVCRHLPGVLDLPSASHVLRLVKLQGFFPQMDLRAGAFCG